jgi:hypothetical protein
MAETKKRQQIILLHGNDAFTKDKALELGLQAGELVVEHGGEVDKVKLHTLDGTGDTANLATFITESAITKTTGALSTRIEDLESALDEYTSEGAVKAKFEDVVSLITGNTKDIEDIQTAIGLVEEGGDGETIFEKIDNLVDILGESSATTEGTVWGEINTLSSSVEDINDAIETITGQTASLEQTLTGYDETNTVAKAVAAAKTTVEGEVKSEDKAYITVTTEETDDDHLNYKIAIENAASAKAFEDFLTEYEEKMAGVSGTTADYVNTKIAELVADAPDAFDTLREIADWITTEASGTTAADIISDVEDLKATLTGFSKTDTVQKKTDALSKSIEDLEDFVQNNDFITVAVENTANNKISVSDTVADGKHSVKLNFDEMVINGGEY